MLTISEARLKDFLKSIKERPLEPNSPFYVPHFQKNNDPIQKLYNHITRDDDTQSVALLSGFRGNGKSTELRRLQNELEQTDYAVLLCDIEPFFNEYEPVDITDFLISVALALNNAMKMKYQEDFLKESYLERVGNFLQTEVKLGGTGKDEFFWISLVREAPFKKRLQHALSTKLEPFVREIRQFFTNVRNFLQQRGYEQMVLLLDSFEKIRGIGENAHQIHESVDYLFRQHIGEKLQLPGWHVVYTVPPYVNSVSASGLGICTFLPNVHISDKAGCADDSGISVMKEVVRRRFSDWEMLFTQDQMKQIILATAGSFRVFFRLIRIILLGIPSDKSQLIQVPITDELLEHATNDLLREMSFLLPTEEKLLLRKIAESKTPEVSKESDKQILMKFMDKDWVFLYHNGEAWFDVNPLLKKALD